MSRQIQSFGAWSDFDMALALQHFVEQHSLAFSRFNATDKYKFYEALINQLCHDREFRHEFLSMGGEVEPIIAGEWVEDKKKQEKFEKTEHNWPDYYTQKDIEQATFVETHTFKHDFTKPFRLG